MGYPDIIKDASEALEEISDRGITVMQGWYDKNIKDCHVTLWDLGETEDNHSDDGIYMKAQRFSKFYEMEETGNE